MSGISAVIATVNRKDELERLFKTIIANQIECAELIVVDQNKNDLIDELILEYSTALPIKHLKLAETNQSKARNHGAAQAKFPVICFPDDDCWFENNSLKEVKKHFETNANTDLLIINWKQNPKNCTKSIRINKKVVYSLKVQISYNTYFLFFRTEAFLILKALLKI